VLEAFLALLGLVGAVLTTGAWIAFLFLMVQSYVRGNGVTWLFTLGLSVSGFREGPRSELPVRIALSLFYLGLFLLFGSLMIRGSLGFQ
jgi:hypothetical protein